MKNELLKYLSYYYCIENKIKGVWNDCIRENMTLEEYDNYHGLSFGYLGTYNNLVYKDSSMANILDFSKNYIPILYPLEEDVNIDELSFREVQEMIENHVDVFNLIPKGLAFDIHSLPNTK